MRTALRGLADLNRHALVCYSELINSDGFNCADYDIETFCCLFGASSMSGRLVANGCELHVSMSSPQFPRIGWNAEVSPHTGVDWVHMSAHLCQ